MLDVLYVATVLSRPIYDNSNPDRDKQSTEIRSEYAIINDGFDLEELLDKTGAEIDFKDIESRRYSRKALDQQRFHRRKTGWR